MADEISLLFQPILRQPWLDLELTGAGTLGLPTTDWTEKSPELVILDLNARQLETLSVASLEMYRGVWLGYAVGEQLTILMKETYFSPRLAATFATCVGAFLNETVNTYTIPAGEYLTVTKSTSADVQYLVDGPLSIPPGLTEDVPVRAVTAGSIGSALAGDIDKIFGDVLPGVSFENTSVATGRDVERDVEGRARARLAVTALAVTGPEDAFRYFAQGGERNGEIDATIAAIGVTRVALVPNLATGAMTVYYATASGPVSPSDVELLNAKLLLRCAGPNMDFDGFTATPVPVDLDYRVYVKASLNVDWVALQAQIIADVTEYFNTLPIGGEPLITPNPPYVGSVTVSKTRGFLTKVLLNGIYPVSNATNTLNLDAEVFLNEDEFPTLGVVTADIQYQ